MATAPPPAADVALATAAVQANARARDILVTGVIHRVQLLLQAFTGWYDDLAVRRMANEVRDIIRPAQTLMTAQEAAYLTGVTELLRKGPAAPSDLVDVDNLRGVDPTDVYRRFAEQYRYYRSQGQAEPDVMKKVLDRAGVVAGTDIGLAGRRQDQAFFEANKITGYRRVIHPELAKHGTCGLCIAASTRIYHKDRLMPIHDRCNCGVMPIIGDFDVADHMNTVDLRDLYTEAGSTSAADLKRTRYTIFDHGELGPTLVPAGYTPPAYADAA